MDPVYIIKLYLFPHRSWRLGILDLRNMNQDFWDVWAGRDWYYSTETERNAQVCNELRQDLKVVTELSLSSHLKEHQAHLLHWAQQRKDCVRLCCVKMKICDSPIEIIKEVLDIFPPDYIEELELYTSQVQPFLCHIAPHLGRMTRLHKLNVIHMVLNIHTVKNTLADIEMFPVQFLSHFCNFNSLKHLSIDGIYFLPGHMHVLFG